MLYEILQNMDGFYVSSCLSKQDKKKPIGLRISLKVKHSEKPINKLFEELQKELNPRSVVGLRHCETITRKTRSEDKTFLRMRPPLKMGIQQPSMGLSTPLPCKKSLLQIPMLSHCCICTRCRLCVL